MTVKVEVYRDGTFSCARGLAHHIFTQDAILDALVDDVREAVANHFEEVAPAPDVLLLTEVKLANAPAAAD